MIDRATFLRSLTAALAVPQTGTPGATGTRAFNVLVLGDSIAWGQGLAPAHRWRELLIARLRSTLGRDVSEIAPQIHSGATIGVGDRNEIDQPGLYAPDRYRPGHEGPSLLDYGPYSGELPSATPTILAQLDDLDNVAPDVPIDLVVVSAGINDVRVARFLNPLANPKFIESLIDLHCRRHLTVLLDRIRVRCVDRNPACKVVVLSYFQMISDQSTGFPSVYDFVSAVFTAPPRSPEERRNRRVIVGIAEAEELTGRQPANANVPGRLPNLVKDVANAAKRFYDASERSIDQAVADANRLDPPAFVHVTPHITAGQALYVMPATNSALWDATIVGHKPPDPTDEVAAERLPLCAKIYGDKGSALNECDIASIGHPNVAGASDGYFDAIWNAIAPVLNVSDRQP